MSTNLEQENAQMKALINALLERWPYVNCVCGRNKPRLSESMRKEMKKLVR